MGEQKIVIADINSQDSAGAVSRDIETENPLVQYVYIPRKSHKYSAQDSN